MTLLQQRVGLALGFGLFAMSGTTATADVLFVPGNYSTIQAAIDAAQDGDIVLIDDGVYTGPGNRDIRFHGKSITVQSAFGRQNCIINAEGTSVEPFRGFIFDSGETTDAVLEGLTIRGGATLPGPVADEFNGGGLFFREASATIKNCVIKGNACGCWGAGVYCNFGASPILINCDISNNHAADDGGALFVWNGGSATLINCNLNDNSAVVTGGAISSFGGGNGIQVINCCLANNRASFGSAIFDGGANVTNSIIWGGTSGELVYQNSTSISYSVVEGGYPGVGNIAADPMFADAADFDYRLRAGSPCIDSGNNDAVPPDTGDLDHDGNTAEPTPFDFDSRPRFVDDPNTVDTGNGTNPIVDIGAIEFQPETIAVAADSVLVTHGTHVSGGVIELADSDNSDFSIQRSTSDIQSRTEFEVKAVSPFDSPLSLELTLEGSVFSRSQVNQTIDLFDYASGSWEQVDSRAATRFTDSTVAVAVTGDLSRFVEAETLCVKARIRYQSPAARQQFSSNTDQFFWTIGQ